METTTIDDQLNEAKPERSFLAQHGQKLGALAIWATIFIGYTIYARANNLGIADAILALADLLRSPAGPIIYIAAYLLRPILLLPALLLTIAGGSIFGPIGILYVIIGANAGALLAYAIGRYFGDGLIAEDDTSDGLIGRYAKRMRDNSFETVFIMRLIFLPYDLVNYLAGFLRIDWKAFLLATILGSIAGTISFTLIGASLTLEQALAGDFQPNPWTLAISVAMFVISIAVSRIVKKREGVDA